MVVAADIGLPNVARLLSFLLSITVCNAYVERVFSVMDCCCGNERSKKCVIIIKSEIAVR
jgi:hypothetical protein